MSPREDEIQVELLKIGGKEISFRVWKLICRVWTNEQLSAEWKTSVMSNTQERKQTGL